MLSSFERTVASSVGYACAAPTGTPNHTARTERDAAGMRSTACETLRSCAILVPGEHADQHGRSDRDPDGGEERARRAAADPAEGEADDVERCPHAVAFRRR